MYHGASGADFVASTDQNYPQLARSHTNSSVSTNATAPNLPGPGRTIGLLLDWLGTRMERFMNICADRRGLGPKAVAQEIRRLRRHDETSIVERHAGSVVRLNKREERAFRKLCGRLLRYARHRIRKTQFEALEEIINLTIEDPHARVVLARYNVEHFLTPKFEEPDLILSTSRALGSIKSTAVHNLWTGVISGRLPEYQGDPLSLEKISFNMITSSGFDIMAICKRFSYEKDFDPKHFIRSLPDHEIYSYLRELKKSLSDPDSSFVAARYLTHALRLGLFRTSGGSIAKSFCDYYSNIAFETPSIIEWSNFSNFICIEDLPIRFDVARHLEKLSPHLVREAQHVQDIFSRFLVAPEPKFVVNNCNDDVIGLHPILAGNCNQPKRVLFAHCLEFLEKLSDSDQLHEQVAFIRNMDRRTRILLKDTVFVSEIFVTYCSIVMEIIRRGRYANDRLKNLQFGSILLASYLNSECEEDRAHATIISSKCSRSNRYFKLALADAVQKNTGQGSLEISAWMGKEVVMPILNYGVSFWPDMLDSVGGTPYLKRFRFGGRYVALTVQRYTYKSPNTLGNHSALHGRECDTYYGAGGQLEYAEVDVMALTRDTVMTICVENGKPFEASGHYPVLAGYDPTGEALYVALSDGELDVGASYHNPQYVTWVKNGASSAAFTLNDGESKTFNRFHVLVLRHDPADLHPYGKTDDCTAPKSAMDPTGPVFWLNLWPNIDPSLPDDPRLGRRRLQSCFKKFQKSFKDGDSDLDVKMKLWRALESRGLARDPRRRIDGSFENCEWDSDDEENEEISEPRLGYADEPGRLIDTQDRIHPAPPLKITTKVIPAPPTTLAEMHSALLATTPVGSTVEAPAMQARDSARELTTNSEDEVHCLKQRNAMLQEENQFLRAALVAREFEHKVPV